MRADVNAGELVDT